MADSEQVWRIHGAVVEKETGRPLGGLIVRAFDKDLLLDDMLGFAITADDGSFEVRFNERRFSLLFEASPDLYLRIYDQHGIRLLIETSDAIRRNASTAENYRVEIPAASLAG